MRRVLWAAAFGFAAALMSSLAPAAQIVQAQAPAARSATNASDYLEGGPCRRSKSATKCCVLLRVCPGS